METPIKQDTNLEINSNAQGRGGKFTTLSITKIQNTLRILQQYR